MRFSGAVCGPESSRITRIIFFFLSVSLFVLINDENWSIVKAKRRKQRKESEGDRLVLLSSCRRSNYKKRGINGYLNATRSTKMTRTDSFLKLKCGVDALKRAFYSP